MNKQLEALTMQRRLKAKRLAKDQRPEESAPKNQQAQPQNNQAKQRNLTRLPDKIVAAVVPA